MNRSFLTTVLAAAAACWAAPLAQAQSVTIYGIADVAVERLSNVGSGGGSLYRMPGLSGSIPSRLGFRGSEDLGDGLKAIFTLNKAQLLALRATYFLSKRSNLYATVGNVDNSGTLALSVSATAAGGAPPAGGSQTGLAAGIRHNF